MTESVPGAGEDLVLVDNEMGHRYEIKVDGRTAFAAYERTGRSIIFTHTEVPAEFQGRGIGSALARGVLDAARADGRDVVPICPFIAGYIHTHPEYLDLVSARNRQRLKLEQRHD